MEDDIVLDMSKAQELPEEIAEGCRQARARWKNRKFKTKEDWEEWLKQEEQASERKD